MSVTINDVLDAGGEIFGLPIGDEPGEIIGYCASRAYGHTEAMQRLCAMTKGEEA